MFTKTLIAVGLLLGACCKLGQSSIYSTKNIFRKNPIIEFSEYYMYGSQDFESSSKAEVSMDFDVYVWEREIANLFFSPENYTIVAAVVRSAKDLRTVDYFPSLCSKHEKLPSYVEWVHYFPTQELHIWDVPDEKKDPTGYKQWAKLAKQFDSSMATYGKGESQLYRARLKGEAEIKHSGLVFLLVQACRYQESEAAEDEFLYDDDFWLYWIDAEGATKGLTHEGMNVDVMLDGTDSFKNPYGYLPAVLFGLLPFEGCRLLGFFAFNVLFIAVFVTHKDYLLNIHYGIMGVVFVATVESALWFATYADMNISGVPSCCPFPPPLIASMIFETLRRTLSRTLLLVVCLGYGVTTPKLSSTTWFSITLLSAAYLAGAVLASSVNIASKEHMHGEGRDNTEEEDETGLSLAAQISYVPVSLLDAVFTMWIYVAIALTMKQLQKTNQSYKYDMYKRLAVVMIVFLVLFIFMSMLSFAAAAGAITIPWRMAWMTAVGWELLNFAILAAVCVIWRPTHRSQMMAYAQQLRTDDEDEDDELDEEEEDGEGGHVEMGALGRRGHGGGGGGGGEDDSYMTLPPAGGSSSNGGGHNQDVHSDGSPPDAVDALFSGGGGGGGKGTLV